MIYIFYTLGILVLLFILYIGIGTYLLLTPTKGRRIDRSARTGSALILIDMQEDYTRREGKHSYRPEDVAKLIGNVNSVIRKAEAQNMPVVTIRKVTHGRLKIAVSRILAGPEGLAGNPGIQFDDRIMVNPSADFEKDRADAFSVDAFEAWLAERKIGQLYIAGIDGCYCIKCTSFGGLNRGFAVTIVEDSTLTAFPDRWQQIRQALTDAGARFSTTDAPFSEASQAPASSSNAGTQD